VLTLVGGGVHRDRATSGGSLPCPWSSAGPPGGGSVPSSLPTVLERNREGGKSRSVTILFRARGRRSCVLGQLGRCTACGEGKGRDGSRALAGGRLLQLGHAGLHRSEGEGGGCWAGLGFRLGFGPQSE
jgi:hypothetical protein